MANSETSRQPKYRHIADALRTAITEGRYGPGDRLPGENELMDAYDVARMTARQALGVLQSEGVAEARKGSGVYVRAFRPIRRLGIQRLAQERWGGGLSVWSDETQGRQLTVDRISVTEEAAPEPIATVLGVPAEEPACVRRRRFVLDGKPVLLAVSYLPLALVARTPITSEDTGPGGIYARLAELGHEPKHFREEVRCRMPNEEEAGPLELSAGTPVILIARTAFTETGTAVEVNEMVLDSASYILEYVFDA